MLELEEAQRRILSVVPDLGAESVPLCEAAGRILAGRVVASVDLPPFDNSAMDGFAVRAADVASAAPAHPVTLRLQGRVAAGGTYPDELVEGACVRLFTGSPLPRGADAVVMQEDTRVDPARAGYVDFLDGAKPWENVRLRGEDVKQGRVLLEPGERLSVGRIGLLSALGCREVGVGRRPRVGLIATGNELIEAGQSLAPGQIYESNRVGLAILARQAGAEARMFPLIPDDLEATQAALVAAFDQCDVIVTSGGVSVGEFDYVKDAFQHLGGELSFWRVAIKPGKPFVFGTWRGRFLFGLPGNPISATVTFLLLVRPALLRMQGAKDLFLPGQTGKLVDRLSNPGDRRHFMRVSVDRHGEVHSTGRQASHVLTSWADANGLVDVPPQTTFEPGRAVSVVQWD